MKYERIRNLREDRDLTQKQVGLAINVPQRTYAYYEAGEHMVPAHVLRALAIFHNVSTDYLVGLTDEKAPSKCSKEDQCAMSMRLRIRNMRKENDFKQQYVADSVRCDQSLYSKYERGEREIPLNLVIQFAQFYNVSVDYLVGLTDDKTPPKRSKKHR